MEKLIELLNEFAPDDFNWCVIEGKIYDKDFSWSDDAPMNIEMGVYVISKQFGFIQWLVENEKIDLNEFMHKSRDWDIFNEKLSAKEDDYLSLLMLLSIQDNPIEFLVSILK